MVASLQQQAQPPQSCMFGWVGQRNGSVVAAASTAAAAATQSRRVACCGG